jgi:hypothetical protein
MDVDDADTSSEQKEVGDRADDDDAMEVHSNHLDVIVPAVGAVQDGNLPDVVVALLYFEVLEASPDTSNCNHLVAVPVEVVGFGYSNIPAQLLMEKTLE